MPLTESSKEGGAFSRGGGSGVVHRRSRWCQRDCMKSLVFHGILPEIGSIFVFYFDFDFEISFEINLFDFDFD